VSWKQRQLAILAVLSAVMCGIAEATGNVFATSIFAYLTAGIVLAFVAVKIFGDDAYER
jgi:hypothetical protein